MGHEVGMSLLSLIPRPGLWRRAEWARQRGEGAGLGVQCGYCEAIYIYVCMYVVCKIIYSHSFFIVAWLKVRQVGCKKKVLAWMLLMRAVPVVYPVFNMV
jgi:hypothetical protein